ncbi:uncharacterized protein LOC111703835 isoform X2 [Eurytemora carolleeae]|uniref:uncharacterized protein LOC111703835 isoform X2 n=1 Tax=Eurytemora carolleeae TaxID=1294199 RepID=UPI000C75E9AD|nr:uncharacterized protein LOC111703835 isoform X2 [Eurytemora carolleeae]|eukprot:XP_023331669.1 uncharacterized protein LOC111703835 isoform X2 [Eurytemora affinis]
MRFNLKDILNTELYPLHEPEGPAYEELVKHSRNLFLAEGSVTLQDFLRPEAVTAAVANIDVNMTNAWNTDGEHNIFLDTGDPEYLENHIRNQRFHTKVSSLAYDMLDPEGPLSTLYRDDNFREFLRLVLGVDKLFRLEDPLGALSVNIFQPGDRHSWHFDQSSHSVTIMLQKPDAGGHFRKTGQIRRTSM